MEPPYISVCSTVLNQWYCVNITFSQVSLHSPRLGTAMLHQRQVLDGFASSFGVCSALGP
jgi:hypothetical protein